MPAKAGIQDKIHSQNYMSQFNTVMSAKTGIQDKIHSQNYMSQFNTVMPAKAGIQYKIYHQHLYIYDLCNPHLRFRHSTS